MGCISSRSTNSSLQKSHTERRILKRQAETHQQTLELNIVYGQSYNLPTGGLWTVCSEDHSRNYPTLTQSLPYSKPPTRARFGEYRCACGRTWTSRLSWQGNYQLCKHCKRSVFPHSQRELRPSDISTEKVKVEQHPRELCQRCRQLGSYCGKLQSNKPRHRKLSSHKSGRVY